MTKGATTTRRRWLAASGAMLAGGAFGSGGQSQAAATNLRRIDVDDLVQSFMRAFETPGIAIVLLQGNEAPWVKGYGVRKLGHPDRVDESTLFSIASNTKAFTVAAISLMVDEGKLGWDQPVVRYMPNFAMYDASVTQMMTVRDLLVHRSGLGLGAGDLMYWPETTHTRPDVVHGLRYLKPVRGFRTGYDYDNVLYVAAGALVDTVSGMSWENFVAERILVPASMTDTVPTISWIRSRNVAGRHARINGAIRGVGTMQAIEPEKVGQAAPSCGVQTNARDMAKWLALQLRGGVLPDGARLWSERTAREIWAPQTIVETTNGPISEDPSRALFTTYALGRFIQDYRGERMIWHYGSLAGQVTMTAFLPTRDAALAILTNCEDMEVITGLRNALFDRVMGAPPFDWLGFSKRRANESTAEAIRRAESSVITRPTGGPSQPLQRYAGRYRDPWYGDVVISQSSHGLEIEFTKTPAFKGVLESWGADAFRTRFIDESTENAILYFTLDSAGKVQQVTLKALSPLADFSFDFHDLLLRPVE